MAFYISRFQNSDSKEFDVEVVTPMFLGGANIQDAELRVPSIKGMLRRVSSFYNCYGDGEPALDYKGLVSKAKTIRIVDTDLVWFDWQRYSHRQDQAMLMGGMTGSITYEGKIGKFMPLVDFCSKVHLGKQTAFGLGKIRPERVS